MRKFLVFILSLAVLLTACPAVSRAAAPQINKSICRTCGKPIANCPYKGKHQKPTPEKKCTKCGKPISKCPYNGKHPAPNPNPTNNKQNEELERLRRENEALRRQQEQQAEAERRKQEEERQRQEAERKRKQQEEARRQQQASQTLGNRTFTANGVSFTMVGVQGGTFQMGQSADGNNANPVHSVTLSSYYIGQTEVTQALWKAVMGSNPSRFVGDNRPVEQVSWNDCQTFIQKLNQLTGERFRLPTEAEWEFAAKGGTRSNGYTYSGSNSIDNVAWYWDNSSNKTHPVATKSPNELGIYDMTGNVWEWCQDWYGSYSSSAQSNPSGPSSGSYRIFRGGSWSRDATYCRTAYRGYTAPTSSYYFYGLRLAR